MISCTRARTADEMGLPCSDPYRMGVEAILDRLLETHTATIAPATKTA